MRLEEEDREDGERRKGEREGERERKRERYLSHTGKGHMLVAKLADTSKSH